MLPAPIQAAVTASRVVCRDETSVRVVGKTWWERVFGTVRPGVWVSDALGSQCGHADDWQTLPGPPAARRAVRHRLR